MCWELNSDPKYIEITDILAIHINIMNLVRAINNPGCFVQL